MPATRDRPPSLICDSTSCHGEGPKTFFVHLQDGTVDTVESVSGLEVTDTSVILRRGRRKAVTYPRRTIFFACCDRDQSPPQC
jgi:hypothetical protein